MLVTVFKFIDLSLSTIKLIITFFQKIKIIKKTKTPKITQR